MRTILLYLFVLLLFIGNGFLAQLASMATPVCKVSPHGNAITKGIPMADAEEKSEEDNVEDNDEKFNLDHRWDSRSLSKITDLRVIYSEKFFKSLGKAVFTPPPKGNSLFIG
jgi:hypothetical protein